MTKVPIYLILLGCAPLALAAAGAQQTSDVPAWHQAQETNEAAAYTYTRFTLAGKYMAGYNASAGRPALMIDCMPRSDSYISSRAYLGANLRAGSPLKIIYVEPEEAHGMAYFPEVAVQYAANDDRHMERDAWLSGADKTTVSVPRRALMRFLQARSVSILAKDDHGTQFAMQFDMPDPTVVTTSCKLNMEFR